MFYVLSNFDRLPYKSPYIHKCVNQILIPCQQVLILIILTYSEKPLGFFLRTAPNPTFCVPSQFVSWSAHPLEPPSETYVYRAVKWKTNFLILDKSSEGSDIDLPMLSNAEQCADMSLFIQPVVGRGWGMH